MSELTLSSSTPKKTQFSSLLPSDIFIFFSFIFSHPLYFFYFVFFSPYLLKLLSFLSPLFITTFLLLITLLTFSPNLVHQNSPELLESKPGFLLTTYQHVLERWRSNADDEHEEFPQFEELEAYKIVFETSMYEARENPSEVLELNSEEAAPVDKHLIHGGNYHGKSEASIKKEKENSVEITRPETGNLIAGGKMLKGFLEENDECETFLEKQIPVKKEEEEEEKNSSKAVENSQALGSNLGSYGSMRKEKEWKRTLACKLFEERHNADGGEGMDLLWETYETESIKAQGKGKPEKGKKCRSESYDDYEEEDGDGQLCCLQALKFSAGKMNLGMGRPNLVKFSKALKGIGWLHNVSRHAKKG